MIGDKLVNLLVEIEEDIENTEIGRMLVDVEEPIRTTILRFALADVSHAVLIGDVDMRDADDMFKNLVKEHKEGILGFINRYVFRVKVKGLSKYLTREIAIPSTFSLGDLGVAIVLAFDGECSHMFDFTLRDRHYAIRPNEHYFRLSLDAFETILKELKFKEKEKFEFLYDFGDCYEFSVEFVKEVDGLGRCPIEVLKGKGHGIWEDNHVYLEMYYQDPNTMVEDWEGDMVPVKDFVEFNQEEFEIDEINEMINDIFHLCREHYLVEEETTTGLFS